MRLVLLGYGYSARAIHREFKSELESLTVTTRTPEKAALLKSEGLNALVFDGSAPMDELQDQLAAATHLVQSAAPSSKGDPLLTVYEMAQASSLQWVGYLSTVGVYGDHGGAWIDETTPPNPRSERSKARLSAERAWQHRQDVLGFAVGVFRLAGIYGPGRSALDRVRQGTARRIVKEGQVFNRIHVQDIGRVVAQAARERCEGIYNVCDDEPGPPQDVITHAAALAGVDAPPVIPFDEADLSPMARSFYGENKRCSNVKIKTQFGPMLYPTYREGLASRL